MARCPTNSDFCQYWFEANGSWFSESSNGETLTGSPWSRPFLINGHLSEDSGPLYAGILKLYLHDTTGWTTGWMFVYTIARYSQLFNQFDNWLNNRLYRVYKHSRLFPVVGLTTAVEQPAASCKQTFNQLSNRLFNRFNNRLYSVNGVTIMIKYGSCKFRSIKIQQQK